MCLAYYFIFSYFFNSIDKKFFVTYKYYSKIAIQSDFTSIVVYSYIIKCFLDIEEKNNLHYFSCVIFYSCMPLLTCMQLDVRTDNLNNSHLKTIICMGYL